MVLGRLHRDISGYFLQNGESSGKAQGLVNGNRRHMCFLLVRSERGDLIMGGFIALNPRDYFKDPSFIHGWPDVSLRIVVKG